MYLSINEIFQFYIGEFFIAPYIMEKSKNVKLIIIGGVL